MRTLLLVFRRCVGLALSLAQGDLVPNEVVQSDDRADERGEVAADGLALKAAGLRAAYIASIMSLVLTAKALMSASTLRLGRRLKMS